MRLRHRSPGSYSRLFAVHKPSHHDCHGGHIPICLPQFKLQSSCRGSSAGGSEAEGWLHAMMPLHDSTKLAVGHPTICAQLMISPLGDVNLAPRALWRARAAASCKTVSHRQAPSTDVARLPAFLAVAVLVEFASSCRSSVRSVPCACQGSEIDYKTRSHGRPFPSLPRSHPSQPSNTPKTNSPLSLAAHPLFSVLATPIPSETPTKLQTEL
ncbi:hypothetical protein F5144DRAFT_184052 [Chaetomium tenue]|uniref:Uncharacterized protein n=1 Tax=Chaetomium tenue TaxID=1854479 RepID=A0ACB7PBT7_9PEZI|nr:hypothetical protein F5144DRAFT_184052 [Chaetomium globosum]